MSVRKRKSSKGFTESYHYRFFYKGKLYYGVCDKCTTKQKALDFEKEQRETVEKSQANKDPGVIPQVIKSLHRQLTGREPEKIAIADAFDRSLEKAKKRKATGDFLNAKRSYWKDFVLFLADKHQEAVNLSDVNALDADAYISYIRENGRYCKKVKSKDGKEYDRKGNLSHKSANTILLTLREVFSLLKKDAGIFENPFDDIELLDNESETREPFTEKELKKIFNNADDFIYPIFAIGIATGLREGDICGLRWDELDFEDNYIRRKMLKTKRSIEIPMIPGLRKYLLELRDKSDSKQEYVLPAHAEMYDSNASGISYRIKQFLEDIEIKTTKKIKGRHRLISVKDCHSLRHSFAYIAGVFNIPLVIVQSILGHMTPEMTKHYQRHADLQIKRKALQQMPDFLSDTKTLDTVKQLPGGLRAELGKILDSLNEQQIMIILSYVRRCFHVK